jgi:hypothetical protein
MSGVITNVASQVIGGTSIGLLVDTWFPSTGMHGFTEGFEILGQLIVDGVLILTWADFANRRGWSPSDDPTRGAFFIISILVSQPKLVKKMQSFNAFIRNFLNGLDLSKYSPPSQATPLSPPGYDAVPTGPVRPIGKAVDTPGLGSNEEMDFNEDARR